MGQINVTGTFHKRNTVRARELRNAATPAERHLWQYLSASQLGAKFSRQMPIGPYFADFLCRAHRLVIELDGQSHDMSPERDVVRDRYLNEAGYTVMHFQNDDILANVEGVICAIRLSLGNLPTPSRMREGGQ